LTHEEIYVLRRIQNQLRRGGQLSSKDTKHFSQIESIFKSENSSWEIKDHILFLTFVIKEERTQDKYEGDRDRAGNDTDDETPPYTGVNKFARENCWILSDTDGEIGTDEEEFGTDEEEFM
jgi:hypothetical protein